jgi:uncharacterized repeat protein (TIGR01451 family)
MRTRHRLAVQWRALCASLCLVAAAIVGAPVALAQTAFTCTGDIYQVQSGQLRVFDVTTSTYVNIGPRQADYNAFGYNVQDDLIYGLQGSNLIRIDANGALSVVFALGFNSNSADMDNAGQLWVQRSRALLTRVNVLTGSTSDLSLTGQNLPNGSGDLAFVATAQGDRIFVAGTNAMSLVDPATGGTVTRTIASYPANEGTNGATWADADGRVFTFKNSSGNIYEIRDYLTTAPYAILVATGESSNSTDGASCRARRFPTASPLAFDDDFTTSFQTSLSGNVLINNGNGEDYDPDGTPLSVITTPVSPPTNGAVTLAANGAFTYTPAAGYSGFDQFTYRVRDSTGKTATALVRITVTIPIVSVVKSVSLFAPTATYSHMLPGNDVIYAIEIRNTGNQQADADSIFVIDSLPAEVSFLNADIDQGGANTYSGSDPVGWTETASGLTFNFATDVRFSDSVARPTSYAECTHSPAVGYRASVRHICFNPKGALQPGGLATLYFRTRIN